MYRNKPPLDTGFRAPQFSLGRTPDTWSGAELTSPGDETMPFPAPSPNATTVVVRRKRRVERPVDGPAVASIPVAPGAERQARVFLVPPKEGAESPDDMDAAAPGEPVSRTTPLLRADGGAGDTPADAPEPPKAPSRRRRATEVTRPSVAVVIRPSVAEQLQAVESAAAAHEAQSGESPFTFDLFINARWGYVDKALDALRKSVTSKKSSHRRTE